MRVRIRVRVRLEVDVGVRVRPWLRVGSGPGLEPIETRRGTVPRQPLAMVQPTSMSSSGQPSI